MTDDDHGQQRGGDLFAPASLIRNRNEIDRQIASLTGGVANRGRLGE
ncbi:MAG: hypothetical protein HY812_19335 [Planctomycetes bacterium]|nr:hypothetical protein [Planctomycetota bacterium]